MIDAISVGDVSSDSSGDLGGPVSAPRTQLRRLMIAAVSAVMLTAPGVAAASDSSGHASEVRSVVDVAGASPYLGRHCNVATPYYTQPGGKEGEPSVGVDPKNPNRRIVAWMDATRATVDVKYTSNGGRSWKSSVPRGIDQCTGNWSQPWEASGDVWVSFGPDGVAYLSTLTWAHFVTPPASDYVSVVHVQTSHDGGRTWSRPVFLAGHNAVSDKPMVQADPSHAGVAYEIWRNQSFGQPVGARGATALLFARTTNGGQSWTSPVHIADGTLSDFFGTPLVSVLRNGTLVATTSLANATGGTDLLSYRSTDHGNTWSGPVVVRTFTPGALATICGQSVAGADASSPAGQQTVVRGKTVVLVSLDGAAAAAGHGAVIESWSRDGGQTWHNRTVIRRDRPIILASVAASRSGGLGLVWDEINTSVANCDTASVPTRTRFASSRDTGATWGPAVTVGAPWWNLASGARGTGGFSGYFVGDYQSLASAACGFTTITVQGKALVDANDQPPITGDTGVMVAVIRR
jgi:hypothetical protein